MCPAPPRRDKISFGRRDRHRRNIFHSYYEIDENDEPILSCRPYVSLVCPVAESNRKFCLENRRVQIAIFFPLRIFSSSSFIILFPFSSSDRTVDHSFHFSILLAVRHKRRLLLIVFNQRIIRISITQLFHHLPIQSDTANKSFTWNRIRRCQIAAVRLIVARTFRRQSKRTRSKPLEKFSCIPENKGGTGEEREGV